MSPAKRIVAAVVLTACVALFPSACSRNPVQVSLAELARDQEEFSGKAVVTSGRVTKFEGPSGHYYVLHDQEQNRVALMPQRRAAPFEGSSVTISGVFEVKAGVGRVIEIRDIDTSL